MIILQQTRGNLSSNDQLSLDLPFAATKSLTARVGPTPSFTRASGATYIGSDGLIHGVDTSTTSNTIGTGSRTFTLAATAGQDQLWRTGDAVDASNGSNSMVGTVTSYTAATQVLVCNMTTTSGSGTFTSWRIGYRGPRFDHDPVTLACRGLLIEESRTNFLTHSNNFADASWTRNNSSLGSTTILAPSGANEATLLIAASNPVSWIFKSLANVSGHTLTFFAKASGKRWANVDASSGAGVAGVWFDLQDGVIGTVQAGYTASITAFANGFYRCRVTYPSSGAGTFCVIGVSNNNSSFVSTASGSDGIIIYGAQLEADSFATSYIPTTTGTLARGADVCSITGSDFSGIWNGADATMFFRGSRIANQTGQTNWDLSSGTSATSIASDRGVTTERIVANAVGIMAISAFSTLAEYKIAAALKTSDYAVSFNGASVITSSSAFVLTLDRMTIGMTRNTTGQLNGWIHSMKFYKKRLPNAKLQALTA